VADVVGLMSDCCDPNHFDDLVRTGVGVVLYARPVTPGEIRMLYRRVYPEGGEPPADYYGSNADGSAMRVVITSVGEPGKDGIRSAGVRVLDFYEKAGTW
jgi:hypothetical protein